MPKEPVPTGTGKVCIKKRPTRREKDASRNGAHTQTNGCPGTTHTKKKMHKKPSCYREKSAREPIHTHKERDT